MREKIIFRPVPMAFGEPGAKQSQDDKPFRIVEEPVRTASVDYGIWSHLSLHSRCGTRISATRPLLARVNLPPSIPARPFGLGWRFNRALTGSADLLAERFAPTVDPPAKQAIASICWNGNQSSAALAAST